MAIEKKEIISLSLIAIVLVAGSRLSEIILDNLIKGISIPSWIIYLIIVIGGMYFFNLKR